MPPSFQSRDEFRRLVDAAPTELVNPQSSSANQWFGRANVSSDTLGPSVVVSTALVNSDSLIRMSFQQMWQTGSSATAMPFAVATISPAGFFKVAAVASCTNVGSSVMMWEIVNAV